MVVCRYRKVAIQVVEWDMVHTRGDMVDFNGIPLFERVTINVTGELLAELPPKAE